jgi:AAA15 family ATPase/GTPase
MTKVNLLRLKFANILSFKDEQEIFFTAESKYTNTSTSYIRNEKAIGEDLITPVTAFYGANASGKSNILYMLAIILRSFLGKPYQKFSMDNYRPFGLHDETMNKPSLLEIDFCVDEFRYILSITFDKTGILEEQLYEYQQKAKKIIYRREKAKLTKFNKDIISKYDLQYTEDTLSKRPDILVLDILDTKGITYIRPILLAVTIISKTAFGVPQRKDFFNEFAEEMLKNKTLKEKFVKFMQYADLGITDVIIEKISSPHPDAIVSSEQGIVSGPYTVYKMSFEHKGANGKKYLLDLNSESEGTRQFVTFMRYFIPALIEGGIFFIDEIDKNIHSMMLAKLIEMFNNPNINKGGAQLIFNTHDTSILKSDILKRDEIWFVEKNEEGCSEVYPLTEFKSIREGFNYEKGYLEGRFGAIPYLGDIKELEAILNAKE